MKLPLAVIVGPTAVGKSAAAVEVADRLDAEIISADSMQVYRGMDIGTSKVTAAEMTASSGRSIPHHLLDVVTPDQGYSVARFQQEARQLIEDISSRGSLPMLVGGTGLYVQSVIDPYRFGEGSGDKNVRKRLQAKIKQLGRQTLYKELKALDPGAAEKIHPNDEKRIIRALEYYYSTGERISDNRGQREKSRYHLAMVGLTMERRLLYQRINARVEKMIDRGLLAEVRDLLDRGYSPELPAMQGLGYKQIAAYCSGDLTWEEAVRLLKRDTRRFAKRQLTWFKRDKRIHWLDVTGLSRQSVVDKIAKYICRTLEKVVE